MQVLIIDRDIDPSVWVDGLHWTDSSGSRSVWYFNPSGADYKTAIDLPDAEWSRISWHVHNLRQNGHNVRICMRREDPGLGIFLPELDGANADPTSSHAMKFDSPFDALVFGLGLALTAPDDERVGDALDLVKRLIADNGLTPEDVERAKAIASKHYRES